MDITMNLGRLLNHDPRSRGFAAPAPEGALKSVSWTQRAKVLDQGDTSSCTGHAMAHLLNAKPFHTREEGYMRSKDAFQIYGMATEIDPFPGTFNWQDPKAAGSEDTGSSGLAVAKAAVKLGYIQKYEHCFGLEHTLRYLQVAPVIVGTNWYSDMYRPDSNGKVTATGSNEGGHEYCLLGMDVENRMLKFLNSWGKEWGKKGYFYMSWDDFDKLLRQDGDVTAPVP